jgi:hypothetical protein
MDPVIDDKGSKTDLKTSRNPFEAIDPFLNELPIIREFHRIAGPRPSDKLIARVLKVLNSKEFKDFIS